MLKIESDLLRYTLFGVLLQNKLNEVNSFPVAIFVIKFLFEDHDALQTALPVVFLSQAQHQFYEYHATEKIRSTVKSKVFLWR